MALDFGSACEGGRWGDEGDGEVGSRGEEFLPSALFQCPIPHAPCPMPNAQHYKRETNPIAPPANTNQAELILNRNTAIALTIARVIVNQSTSAARPNV